MTEGQVTRQPSSALPPTSSAGVMDTSASSFGTGISGTRLELRDPQPG